MVSKYNIFVVDDEPSNLESIERILKSDGANVKTFADPKLAIAALRTDPVDVVLTDLRMGPVSGLDLLEAAKFFDTTIEVILITAYGTVEVAVEAIKKGAYDFVTKPLQRTQVLKVVHKALERRSLVQENSTLRQVLSSGAQEPMEIVGRSMSLIKVKEVALQAARSRASVFIEGESGTGKGLIAEFIHRFSQCPGLLVKINCTALPDGLLEAELFGYEAGAFTGALKRKRGRVELAVNGTLFLDEIGIAPITLQTKLLRFLQDGDFERLGSNDVQHIETRVVSATNVNLKEAIQSGKLREDLFYRLNVIHIRMPSLRERSEDIPQLIYYFLDKSAKRNGREVPVIEEGALEHLRAYGWPGNIRELQNLMERLVVLSRTGLIKAEDLPYEITGEERPNQVSVPIGMPLKNVEKLLIEATLRSTRGEKRLAARLLGIHPRTIYRHLEALTTGTGKVIEQITIENELAKDFPTMVL